MLWKKRYIRRLGGNIKYNEIETLNKENGKPYITIYDEKGIENNKFNIELSITHDNKNATAIVIVEERG